VTRQRDERSVGPRFLPPKRGPFAVQTVWTFNVGGRALASL